MVYENIMAFLPHRFNDACLIENPNGEFRCQKSDNVRFSNEKTKHQFMPPTNEYLVACLKIL